MSLETVPAEAPKTCERCPRLVTYRNDIKEKEPDWFNGAVPSFGDPEARVLIVGLAPGLRGANRTGRPFTGDGSGETLFRMLETFAFTAGRFENEADDGLRLNDIMITNAVRCVPPRNRPIGSEITSCRPYLAARIEGLPALKLVLTLGKIAHDSTVRALGLRLKDHPFGHGRLYDVDTGNRRLSLLSSYHCSRYNLNTGRLTDAMFEEIFSVARQKLSEPAT